MDDDLLRRRVDAARRAYYRSSRGLSTPSPAEVTAWVEALNAPDVDTAVHALIRGLYGDAAWTSIASDHTAQLRRDAMARARAAAEGVR